MLLFSFFAFFKFGDNSYSAWSGDVPGLFPISLYPVLFGVAMAAQIALTRFANVKLPDHVLGFTWKQIHLILGAFAALLMLGYLITEKGSADFGFGFFIMLLGSIALVVGAVMYRNEGDTAPSAGTTPPTPF